MSEITKLWRKVLTTRSKCTKAHSVWLSAFLTKFVHCFCDTGVLPKEFSHQEATISNVLSHSLLSDIHDLCGQAKNRTGRQSQSDVEDQEVQLVREYLMKGRGWKIIWVLQAIRLQGLSYFAELSELLLSLLTMVVHFPAENDALVPVNLELCKTKVPIEECFHLVPSTQSHSEEGNRDKPRKCRSRIRPVQSKSNSSDSDNSLVRSNGIRRNHTFPLVPFVQSNHNFEYFSHPWVKSDEEEPLSSEEEDENDLLLISKEQGPNTTGLSAPFLVDLILSLLQKIILDQRKFTKAPKCLPPHLLTANKISTSISHLSILFKSLVSPKWTSQSWNTVQVQEAASQLLRLILVSASSLRDCSENANIREELMDQLLEISKLKESVDSIFSYECLLSCLWTLYCELGAEYANPDYAKRLVKTFIGFGGAKLFLRLFLKIEGISGGKELNDRLLFVLGTILYKLKGPKKYYSSKKNMAGAIEIPIHHHNETSASSGEDDFCDIHALSSIYINLIPFVSASESHVSILSALTRTGVCCCAGFQPLFDCFLKAIPRLTPEQQIKSLLFLEGTLLKQASDVQGSFETCHLCSMRVMLLDHGSSCYWRHLSLYVHLLHSSDWLVARVVCRHLLTLVRTNPQILNLEIFNEIVAPVFMQTTDSELNEEKSVCLLEFCLLSMGHLFQNKATVKVFLELEFLSRLKMCLEVPRLRHLAVDVLVEVVKCSQQLVDKQSECHPGALLLLDDTLATCGVQPLKDIIAIKSVDAETLDSEVSPDLSFYACVWHSCRHLCSLPTYRSHLVSSEGLSAAYRLLEEVLFILQQSESRRSSRVLVWLLESLLAICIALVPFYVIPDSQHITGDSLLETVKTCLIKMNVTEAASLRYVYDSVLNCCVGISSTLRTPTISWTIQVSEDETFDRCPGDLEKDSGSSYEADAESQAEDGKPTGFKMSPVYSIGRPAVAGLILHLLECHLVSGGRNAARAANYALQRLASLSRQNNRNTALLYGQGIMQFIYNFMNICFAYEDKSLKRELLIVLVDLWSCIASHSISRAELSTYLQFFKDHSDYVPLLLDRLTVVVGGARLEPCYSLLLLADNSPPSTEFTSYLEGPMIASLLENIPSDRLPHLFRESHLNTSVELVEESPWALSTIQLPLTYDPGWNPRQKGFSLSLWIKFNCEAWKSQTKISKAKFHMLSVGCNRWLLEIWCQSNDGSLIVRISDSTRNGHKVLAELTFGLVLNSDVWQHLALSYVCKDVSSRKEVRGEFSLTVDGCRPHTGILKYSNRGTGTPKYLTSVILIGHCRNAPDELWQLGTLMIFKEPVLDLSSGLVLSSLGPDLENLTEASFQKWNFQVHPLTDRLLRTGVNILKLSTEFPTIMRNMQANLYAVYNARSPSSFLLYPHVVSGGSSLLAPNSGTYRVLSGDDRCSQHHPTTRPTHLFGKVSLQNQTGLHLALEQLGGTQLLLFLFAKVVEVSDKEGVQSQGLALLLCVLRSFPCCCQDFLRQDQQAHGGPVLLIRVLESAKCCTGALMLKTLINGAVSQPLMCVDESSGQSNLDSQTDSLVTQPWMLALCVDAWRAWTPECLACLFRCLEILVREKHNYSAFNIGHLHKVNIVQKILDFLKELFLDWPEPDLLPCDTCDSICRLLCRMVANNVPLLRLVWQMLLLLHPQDRSHLAHSYFLGRVSKHPRSLTGGQSSTSGQSSSSSDKEATSSLEFSDGNRPQSQKEHSGNESLEIGKDRNSSTGSINMSGDEAIEKTELLQLRRSSSLKSFASGQLKSKSALNRDATKKEKEHSIIFIVTGLLQLVRDVLVTSPDSFVGELIPDVVRPTDILMLANHESTRQRAAIVQLFGVFSCRAAAEVMDSFVSMQGYQLLTNQLRQGTVDDRLYTAVNHILSQQDEHLQHCGQEEESTVTDTKGEQSSQGALLLLGLMSPTTVSKDPALVNKILGQLVQICWSDKNAIIYLVKNGAVEIVCSLLLDVTHKEFRIADKNDHQEEVLLWNSQQFLCALAEHFSLHWDDQSCINHLEDLLVHLCSHFIQSYERCGVSSQCTIAFRNCVCVILDGTLNLLNKLLDYALSERFRDTVVSELLASLPSLLHPFVSLPPDMAQLREKMRGNKASRAATTALVQRFQQLTAKGCDFLVFQNIIDTITHSSHSYSSSEKDLCLNLLNVLVKKLQISLVVSGKAYTSFRFAALRSLRKFCATQLSKFLLWRLLPDHSVSDRCCVVNYLLSLEDYKEVLDIVLDHTSLDSFQQMLSFLHALLDKQLTSQEKLQLLQMLDHMLKKHKATAITNELISAKYLTWLENAEVEREHWQAQVLAAFKVCSSSQQPLLQEMWQAAQGATQQVLGEQNLQRKAFMQHLKVTYSQRLAVQRTWKEAVATLTHERALWHDPSSSPSSWQLDPTEGPLRVRRKLQRCFLNIAPKFVLPEARKGLEAEHRVAPLSFLFDEDDFSSGRAALIQRLHSNERIVFCCNCTIVLPAQETCGEILIGDRSIHFVGERESQRADLDLISRVWPLSEIREVLLRRFHLQDKALELFLTNGQTYLLAFKSTTVRDDFFRHLNECFLPSRVAPEQLGVLTDRWRQGEISNFEYLTQLNKLAGRSFNDLMQYPVFPFILTDYTSDILDLTLEENFRNLSKPMAIQNKEKEQHYVNLYKFLKKEHESCSPTSSDMLLPTAGPYHYGSHYSNSGTVLHFLVRLPPFTKMLLAYQDRNFDIPDRTFHSLRTSWRLASGDSPTDFKELIPEFYFLPEFLVNSENLDLGVRQTGEPVRDVLLPPWCGDDARLFVLAHRQALECPLVTRALHRWIDLVFGYQQTGKAAVEAINLFHPATYYGLDLSPIQDPLQQGALKTMIRTFGQMPKQLFKLPHPASSWNPPQPSPQARPVLPHVIGLCWGTFLGSPSTETPVVAWSYQHPVPLGTMIPLATGEVFGLAPATCLLLCYSKEKVGFLNATYVTSTAVITWSHPDGVVRLKARKDAIPLPLFPTNSKDQVTVCVSIPDCSVLLIGRSSGLIQAHNLDLTPTQAGRPCQLSLSTVLYGHRGAVTCLVINKPFSVAVSGSADGTLILWDLNRFNYVRTLISHENAVISLCCVSDTLGDVASVAVLTSGCCLNVHTINGIAVGRIQMPNQISALGYSSAAEGHAVNVLATGFVDGSVRLWSSWNLESVCDLRLPGFSSRILCLTYSSDNQHLFLGNAEGKVFVWQRPSKPSPKVPTFLTAL